MKSERGELLEIGEGLAGFYHSWQEVDWEELIHKAEKSLDIAVFYWDKWTEFHLEALFAFLSRPDTRVRFIFTDDRDTKLLRAVREIFPDHTEEEIRQKIDRTTRPLEDFVKANRFASSKVEVVKVDKLLSYPFQIIDSRFVVLSVFEMVREGGAKAPAFLIDLEKSETLARFFEKELQGLLLEKKRD